MLISSFDNLQYCYLHGYLCNAEKGSHTLKKVSAICYRDFDVLGIIYKLLTN